MPIYCNIKIGIFSSKNIKKYTVCNILYININVTIIYNIIYKYLVCFNVLFKINQYIIENILLP